MRRLVMGFILVATGCGKAPGSKPAAETMPVAAAIPPPQVGSAQFHLDLAAVFERYRDTGAAAEHLSKAVSASKDPAVRAQAYAALGRVKQAADDLPGAIAALELARVEERAAHARAGSAVPFGGFGVMTPGGDLTLQLARLYAERGEHEKATEACQRGLAEARWPWQRDEYVRLKVALARKAGTLGREIAEAEKTLDAEAPSEAALRFLAAALGGGARGAPDAVMAPEPSMEPQGQATVATALVRAYERLHELHPDDLQVRMTLQGLLERAGRVDDAVALARTAPSSDVPRPSVLPPASPADPSMECGPLLAAQLGGSPALQRAGAAIRIRIRGGQKEKAIAETTQLVALAKQEGAPAHVLAAELFSDLGETKRATEALRRAAAAARSRAERRGVALASERAVQRAGRPEELKPLYASWERSDDPCLRRAAQERRQAMALMPQGMPPPFPSAP